MSREGFSWKKLVDGWEFFSKRGINDILSRYLNSMTRQRELDEIQHQTKQIECEFPFSL